MRILAISEAGYSSDLFLRMQDEGHNIRLWIKEKPFRSIYDDMLPKVAAWQSSVQWSDLIVFDHTGMSDIWKQVRYIKPCFGGSEWADKLEKDRMYAKQIFNDIGLNKIESLRVKNWLEAVHHVTKDKKKHVIKPVGKMMDSHNVIIGEYEDGSDAAALMQAYEDQGLVPDYIEIEERKEGIEAAISVWYTSDGKGNGRVLGDVNINFEHKRLMSGFPEGVGPLCGEAGTAMRYESQENPFFKETVSRMLPLLAKNNYRGQIDISFIMDEEGKYWPLEITPRLGYPSCMIEQSLQKTTFSELFTQIALGNTDFENITSGDWAVGVVCFMPGFPSLEEVKKRSVGIPVFGLNGDNEDHVHLVEVAAGKNFKRKTNISTTEGMGYPMVITGTGRSIQDAKSDCYKVINNSNKNKVWIPNMFYRNDIGDRVIRSESELEKLGIFGELKYAVLEYGSMFVL